MGPGYVWQLLLSENYQAGNNLATSKVREK
jgi:hypothetical protein